MSKEQLQKALQDLLNNYECSCVEANFCARCNLAIENARAALAAAAPVAPQDPIDAQYKRDDEVWIRGKVMDAYDNNPIYVAPYCVSNSTGTVGVNLEDIRHAPPVAPEPKLRKLVPDWLDAARQRMQVIMTTAGNIGGKDGKLIEREVERLSKLLTTALRSIEPAPHMRICNRPGCGNGPLDDVCEVCRAKDLGETVTSNESYAALATKLILWGARLSRLSHAAEAVCAEYWDKEGGIKTTDDKSANVLGVLRDTLATVKSLSEPAPQEPQR